MHACAALSVYVTTQNGRRSLDVLCASCCFGSGYIKVYTKLLLPFSVLAAGARSKIELVRTDSEVIEQFD